MPRLFVFRTEEDDKRIFGNIVFMDKILYVLESRGTNFIGITDYRMIRGKRFGKNTAIKFLKKTYANNFLITQIKLRDYCRAFARKCLVCERRNTYYLGKNRKQLPVMRRSYWANRA